MIEIEDIKILKDDPDIVKKVKKFYINKIKKYPSFSFITCRKCNNAGGTLVKDTLGYRHKQCQ